MGIDRFFVIFVSFFYIQESLTQSCDYAQNIALGQRYYIYNPEYPNNYQGSQICRWVATSPANTRIVITCEDVDLPTSPGCTGDRLLISLNGDTSFNDGLTYCDPNDVSFTSNTNALAVALVAPSNTQGGRFLCSIAAAQIQTCDCGWKASNGRRKTLKESESNNSNVTLKEYSNTIVKREVGDEVKKLGAQRGIVGGQDALPNEYPLMAALIDTSISTAFCGASVLSPRFALTAAHCDSPSRPVSNVALLVGDTTLSEANETPAAALYRVARFIIHENYNSDTNANDIALIYTQSIISLSYYVGPACLPFGYSQYSFTGQSVTALGWGLLEFSGAAADTLQKVDLGIISNSQCAQSIGTVYNSQVCTFASGKDTCQGDSGGPLLWGDSSNRLQLVGIVSYGGVCASNGPAINTRLTSYLSWIVANAPSVVYCI